jgi:hypothetical protein
MDSKRVEAVGKEIDRHLAHLLRPGGEIDTKVRKPVKEWLSGEVILEGAGVCAKMTLASWLTLVTKAYKAGWSKGFGAQTVTAEDARQLAAALAKADLGQKWQPLVTAVQTVAMAGEFRVYYAGSASFV